MKLSDNFSLSEFTVSATAIRRGIKNNPPPIAVTRLKRLTTCVLQPLRDRFGPIIVTSGYRSARLNATIGGAPDSQHERGEAADIKIPGVSHLEVCKYIVAELDFDQLIYEFGEDGWIHVSYATPAKNRKDVLRAYKSMGRTRYRKGLR